MDWRIGGLVSVGLAVWLTACSTTPPPEPVQVDARVEEAHDPRFPLYPELEPAVAFWQNVYSRWDLNQTAVHDNRYLDVVYAVETIPGPADEGYSTYQRAFLAATNEAWQARLQAISDRHMHGLAQDPNDAAIIAQLVQAGGPAALIGAGERVRTQRGQRSRFMAGVARSGAYLDDFRRVFRERGLPEDLVYLPHVESSFRPLVSSSAGAVGMWQFTKPAARTYMNLTPAVDERLDPLASAVGASRYLEDAYGRLGSWPLAVTSYNHGIGGMGKARSEFGDDMGAIAWNYTGPYFGFASRNFYAEFLAARSIAKNPEQYFGAPVAMHPPERRQGVQLLEPESVVSLSARLGVPGDMLALHNPAWLRNALSGRHPLPAGHWVWLPADTPLSGEMLAWDGGPEDLSSLVP